MRDPGRFRFLLLGDFGGRASRGECSPGDLRTRRIHGVDRDDFEEVFTRLGVALALPTSGTPDRHVVRCKELDDLAPDRLFHSVPLFAGLRTLRRRLDDPATFADAARALGAQEPPRAKAESAPPVDLLASSLEATRQDSRTGSSIVDALLREIVVPHVTPARDPRAKDLVASVDAGIAEQMRRILRDPCVRRTEAAWRGVEMLLRRCDSDRAIALHLLDVTAAELTTDLCGPDAPRELALRIADASDRPGAERFDAIVCADGVLTGRDGVCLLAALAEVARASGALLLGDADPRWLGVSALHVRPDPREWGEVDPDCGIEQLADLRRSAAARHVALALPRLMFRLPYGRRGGEVEGFEFEEIADAADHEGFPFGPAAFALATVIGTAYERDGRAMRLDATFALEQLPADVRERDGEMTLTPPSEVVLGERAAEAIRASGFCALRSVIGSDAVRLGPLVALAGVPLVAPGR